MEGKGSLASVEEELLLVTWKKIVRETKYGRMEINISLH